MIFIALHFSVFSDDANLEIQFSPWCILHLEDSSENPSLIEAVVVLQTDTGLGPVSWETWSCGETHLKERNVIWALSLITCLLTSL